MFFYGFGVAAPRTRRKTVANRGEPMGTRKNQSFNKNHGFSNPEPTRGKRVETTKKLWFFNGSEGSKKI